MGPYPYMKNLLQAINNYCNIYREIDTIYMYKCIYVTIIIKKKS